MTLKQKSLIFPLVILALIMCQGFALALKVPPPEKIEFLPNLTSDEKPVYPRSIFLSEDGLITIIDEQNQSISTFQQKGDILIPANSHQSEFGSNSVNKFIGPAYSCYTSDGSMALADLKLKRIFYYQRSTENWSAFNYQKEFLCSRGCTALYQVGKKLIVAGSTTLLGQNYELYAIDIDTSKLTPLLTEPQKYGIDNLTLESRKQINAIGITGYICGSSDGSKLVYAWEGGHIVVLTIDGKILKSFDAKETKNYSKPVATSTLIANRLKNPYEARTERLETMSFIRGIFATSHYFYIIYEGPAKGKPSVAWIQKYDFYGNFLEEASVPRLPKGGNKMFWFDKENGVLYSLSVEEFNPLDFFILKYKISE